MAETIKNQIDALTGFASTEDNALQDWCDAGAKELINVFPPSFLAKCITASTLSNSPTTLTSLDTRGKVVAVTRNDGTRARPCRLISSINRGMVNDSSDLINYAVSSDPVYLIYNNTLEIYPVPTSAQNATVEHTSFPTVNLASSEIGNFPDEAQYLVVLYAATKALQRKMSDKDSDLPSDIVAPVLEVISESLPSWSAPSDLVIPVKPAVPSISSQVVADPSGSAPTYTKPVMSLGAAPTISDLSITAVPPEPPTLSSTSVSFTTTAPSYASPNVSFEGATSTSLTDDLVEITSGQIGTDDDFEDFNKWFTALGEMIEDDEDIELASAQIEKINTYIQAYNVQMQDSLNEFNDDMAEYQAQLQISIQNAQFDNQEDARKVQRFQAETSLYQVEVTTQVQEYQQNLAGDIQVWQAERQTDLQKYSTDIQNELNEFNKENAKYQAILQEYIQEAQLLDAHEARKLQKYQIEVGTYGAELNANVQKFTQELAKNRAAFDTSVLKYTSEVQKVTASNSSTLAKYTGEVGDFTARLQKHTADYQWLQGQYVQLKADYQQGLQFLVTGGIPQQQQQA